MSDRAIRSTLQILTTDRSRIVGMGFLAPPKLGAAPALVAITCAHVVATALGEQGLQSRPDAPEGEFGVRFPGSNGMVVASARVMPGGWCPVDDAAARDGKPHDIAVLKIALDAAPAGTDLPKFCDAAVVTTPVHCFGPKRNSGTNPGLAPHSVEAEIRASGQLNRIEFLVENSDEMFLVVPGFSGGPLFDLATDQIIGMVRSVDDSRFRQAYALPFRLLAEIWSPLSMGRAATPATARVGELHPVFDLIDRQDQINLLPAPLGQAIRERRDTGFSAPRIITFAAVFDDDEDHFSQRLCHEIEDQAALVAQSVKITRQTLVFPRGTDPDARMITLREELGKKLNLRSFANEDIGAALDKEALAWMFHIGLPRSLDAADKELITRIDTFFGDLAKHTVREIYLSLCLRCNSREDYRDIATDWLVKTLDTGGDSCVVLPLTPLGPVNHWDVGDWSVQVDHTALKVDPGWLSNEVVMRFDDQPELPMRKLRAELRNRPIVLPDP